MEGLVCNELMEISLSSLEQKHLPDKRFPAVFTPENSNKSVKNLSDLICKHNAWIKQKVVKHGAVLFRGWDLSCGEDFNSVFDALGYKEFSYKRGRGHRKHVVGSVYTANELELSKTIGFHNEMAYLPDYPDVIMFFCERPSPEGGETALLSGEAVYKRIAKDMPDLLAEMEKDKFEYYTKLGGAWKDVFGTTDKLVAEERAKANCTRLEWAEDGEATVYIGPFVPTLEHPLTGVKLWFNSIGMTVNSGDKMKYSLRFGDGRPVLEENILKFMSVCKEEQIVVRWQKGDLVIVDNLSVMHSRLPGFPPRSILVALGKND